MISLPCTCVLVTPLINPYFKIIYNFAFSGLQWMHGLFALVHNSIRYLFYGEYGPVDDKTKTFCDAVPIYSSLPMYLARGSGWIVCFVIV